MYVYILFHRLKVYLKLFNFVNNANNFYDHYCVLFPLVHYLREVAYFYGFVKKHVCNFYNFYGLCFF